MLIYHYSKEKYDKLLTLEKQRNITPEERVKAMKAMVQGDHAGMYFEHISFFIDPLPLDVIAGIFGGMHPVWQTGTNLFQYVVETSLLPRFKYEVVESPEKTELYYDDNISTEEYYRRLKQLNKEKGYVGNGSTALTTACKPLVGRTREFYQQLSNRSNFDELKNKYAATVPHLMLYPDSGIIHYKNVSIVKIA